MNDTTPWYASKGVWGSLVAIVATLLAVATHNKVQILPADQDQLVSLIATAAGAVGGIVALYGRLTATKQIGPSK